MGFINHGSTLPPKLFFPQEKKLSIAKGRRDYSKGYNIRVVLGLYWDNGKENGYYYYGIYRVYIGGDYYMEVHG